MNNNELVKEGDRKKKKTNSRFREQHACVKAWKSLAPSQNCKKLHVEGGEVGCRRVE